MSVVVSPITNHANREHSHRTGWARMWSNCLGSKLIFNQDWSNEPVVYFEHGMEFNENSKSVNVFLKEPESWDKLAKKAEMFMRFSGKLYSLDIDCPDYGERLKSRVRPHSTERYKILDFDKISSVCKSAQTLKQSDIESSEVVLGDSHSLSAWKPGSKLCRIDGQTLNGALERGFSSWIDGLKISNLETLRTYFGNIDIRHHVCRLATKPMRQRSVIEDLVDRYFKELNFVKEKYAIKNVEVTSLLPVENPSRKLPKTGYYKGKPFWGSWNERSQAVNYFNMLCKVMCKRNGFMFVDWPSFFKNEQGELGFEYMEKPRSVHISPRHYLWDAFNE